MTKPFIPLDAYGGATSELATLSTYNFGAHVEFPEDVAAGPARNAWRAKNAAYALDPYARAMYRSGHDGEPLEQTIRDLLGDLRHLCDLLTSEDDESFDLEGLLSRTQGHYTEEVHGE